MLTRTTVVNVIEELDRLGAIRAVKPSNNWYQICCPFHNDGNERRPSCGVLLENQVRNGQEYQAGMFHCFVCGSKPFSVGVREICKNKGIDIASNGILNEAVSDSPTAYYEKETLISDDVLASVSAKFMTENLKLRAMGQVKPVTEEELAGYRYTVPYMYERKLTDEIIERYDVGFDGHFRLPGRKKETPCITFPVRDITGKTLFLCRRSIEGKLFHYPEEVTKPVYGIYELPKDAKEVIVCESCFNALTAAVYGFNAVALLGTGNPYQINQLKRLGVREFVLCLDYDPAGIKGTKRLKKELSKNAFVWTMTVPEGKDVNDLTKEEFLECYNAKE